MIRKKTTQFNKSQIWLHYFPKDNNIPFKFKCLRCGSNKEPFHRHHKDGNWQNDIISNLELICEECHKKEHPFMNNYKGKNALFNSFNSLRGSKK